MAYVSLSRFDKLPDLCICCGEPAARKLRLKFAPLEKVSFASVVFGSAQLRRILRILPTIPWTLPFCDAHARTASARQYLQIPLILSGFCFLGSAAWSFGTTNATWSPIISLVVGLILIVLAHHTALRPVKVTHRVLECENVDEQFVLAHREVNQIDVTVRPQDSSMGFDQLNVVETQESFFPDLR